MTFEGSRKKQVLVLQPRGKALYEDDSSFGSKMLAKMGWNKGNGLGKSQHGAIDFIQIRYKNNASGLGFDGLKDNQWTENESNFDNLLKSLNSNSSSNTNSGDEGIADSLKNRKSLEEKSKNSRARVHYKKFTRGKDIAKYSDKELANIFGKKSLVEVNDKPIIEEVVEVEEKPETYKSDLIVNTGVSVTDYFKQKMESKMNPKTIITEISVEQLDGDDEIPKKTKKQKKQKQEEPIEDVIIENIECKSKRNKRKLESEEVVIAVPEDESPVEPLKKKKKKSKKSEENIASQMQNTLSEVENKSEIIELEPELPVTEKKKKKSKNSEVQILSQMQDSSVVSEGRQKRTKSKTDKKKKKSKKNATKVVGSETAPQEVQPAASSRTKKPGEEFVRGANAVYSTNIIQIPTYIAQKMSSMSINHFINANVGDVVGYGLNENVEIKTVKIKMRDNANSNNTDKYSLYNMDQLVTSNKTKNLRKLFTKLKRTKRSIQVL